MVKGTSRQIILVDSPDRELFDQAIFILKDGGKEVSDEALLREAKRLVGTNRGDKRPSDLLRGACWTLVGALFTAALWLFSAMF